jgi:serine/threonine protein kinase
MDEDEDTVCGDGACGQVLRSAELGDDKVVIKVIARASRVERDINVNPSLFKFAYKYMLKKLDEEITNLKILSDIQAPNSILYYSDSGANWIYLVKKSAKYPIYKLMHGDMTMIRDMQIKDIDLCYDQCKVFLTALHARGYYHFDIKPDNILYTKTNDLYEFAVGDYDTMSVKCPNINDLSVISPLMRNMRKPTNVSTDIHIVDAKELFDAHTKVLHAIHASNKTHAMCSMHDLYCLGLSMYSIAIKHLTESQLKKYKTKCINRILLTDVQMRNPTGAIYNGESARWVKRNGAVGRMILAGGKRP